MAKQRDLIDRIVRYCGSGLAESKFDLRPYSDWLKQPRDLARVSGVYGVTGEHPSQLEIENSSVQGSFLLGKCAVKDSVIYCSDLRGDELKCASAKCAADEELRVRDSYLYKSLVHSNSHDPENPGDFFIRNSIVMDYANVHGAPIDGCFLKPFATIDLTSAKNCALGTYSYVQTGKLDGRVVEDGCILISAKDFQFEYTFDPAVLRKYVRIEPGGPGGLFIDLLDKIHSEFEALFGSGGCAARSAAPGSFCHPYALMKGDLAIGGNVFVSQRAYIENSSLGDGSNAQENCCIIGSVLEGNNVSAHGSKMIRSKLGKGVFTGFNSFVRDAAVGSGCIIAPHTIIDCPDGIEIPPEHIVWGYVGSGSDLAANCVPLDGLARGTGEIKSGRMVFRGDGAHFVKAFRHRIEHILEGNGAFCSGDRLRGHAQMYQNISFRALEPRREGELQGFFAGGI
ncbi:MAG: hypothetical protein WAW37_05615 [Syntrophobacteraceae bacterium]